MNLLLLEPSEVEVDGTACLSGRRARHAHEVLRAQAGDSLRVGVLGGKVGTAEVLASDREQLTLRCTLDSPPPPRAGVDLLLAIPRPKQLKRVLQAIASLGVDRVVLCNAARVEKSYFDSKVLTAEFIDGLLREGLEQGRDTVPPTVTLEERFRPFVEDRLDATFGKVARILPHPPSRPERAIGNAARRVFAIGPDGGWVPFEVELLERQGFIPVSLGPRPLRVEVAVPYILGAYRNPSR